MTVHKLSRIDKIKNSFSKADRKLEKFIYDHPKAVTTIRAGTVIGSIALGAYLGNSSMGSSTIHHPEVLEQDILRKVPTYVVIFTGKTAIPMFTGYKEYVEHIPYSAAYDSIFPTGAAIGGTIGGALSTIGNYVSVKLRKTRA